MNDYQISRQKAISIVSMRVYFYKGYTEGIPFTSWKNEVHKLTGRVQHDVAWDETIKLATEKFAGKFKRAILYDNINNVQIYQNDAGNVVQRAAFFYEQVGKDRIMAGIEYDHFVKDNSGKLIRQEIRKTIFTKEQMQMHVQKNFSIRYQLLEEMNAGKQHNEAREIQIERGRSKDEDVYFSVDQLRNDDALKNLDAKQLSAVADYLLKMKGLAA